MSPRKKVDKKDKKRHREFVWLTPSEYEHLSTLLGKDQCERWIDELNLYIGSKGDKYESHYYTIQVWARRDSAKKAVASPLVGEVGEGAARRAAETVIAALKDPANKTMPRFDEKTTKAIFAVMRKRLTRWPDLREMRGDAPLLEQIHDEIVTAYQQA